MSKALALVSSVADLTADAVSINLQHKEAANKHNVQVQDLKQQVESLQRSNDILHAQIQTSANQPLRGRRRRYRGWWHYHLSV